MNKERILALADLIEKQPHTDHEAISGFSMEGYVHTCGTPCCIAGWAVAAELPSAAGTTRISLAPVHDGAADLLGLTVDEADELFFGGVYPLHSITPAQAAACLRHLAESGEVDWDRAMKAAA